MTKKRISDFKDSKVFCPAPFVHMYIHSNETPKPCCAAEQHTLWTTPKVVRGLRDEWESFHYTELRESMLQEVKSDICKRCYAGEETGGKSDRLIFMDRYLELDNDIEVNVETGNEYHSPLDLDLRPGNLCNLQCRMCGPASSSQLNKEIKKNEKILEFILPFNEDNQSIWASDRNLDFLLGNIDKGVSQIKFLGGEPTIMPEVDRIMDYLIDNDKTDITLYFTTNLTNSNKKFLDKISKFRCVLVNVSMDGIGDTLEYIRYPVSWRAIQKNLVKIAKLPNVHTQMDVSFTLQAYNLCNLKDTLRWAIDVNERQDDYRICIAPENLTEPKHFSYRSLPKEFRDTIIKDIMNSPEYIHPDSNVTGKLQSRLEYMLADDVVYDITKFAEVTFRYDLSRGQHIKDSIPELWDILAPAYNTARKRYYNT